MGVELYHEVMSRYMTSGYPTLIFQLIAWILLPMPPLWFDQPSADFASSSDMPVAVNYDHTFINPFKRLGTARLLRTWRFDHRCILFWVFLRNNPLLTTLLILPLLPPLLTHCVWGMMAFFFGPIGLCFTLMAALTYSVRFYSRCGQTMMCFLLVGYRWMFTLLGSILLRTSYVYGLLLWQYGNPNVEQQWNIVGQEICLRDTACYIQALEEAIKPRVALASLFT